MFKRTLLLVTICLAMPSSIITQDANSLLDMNFVKQFLPSEYHSTAEATAQSLQAVIGGGSSTATSSALSGLSGSISTQTPIPSIPLPSSNLQYTPPQAPATPYPSSFNPYMPSAPTASAPVSTAVPQSYYPQPAAPAPAPAPVAAAPVVSSGPANPFLGGGAVQSSQPAQELILKADLNANPVFHPPLESTVPQYPPIEGQHWYQYVLVNNASNP